MVIVTRLRELLRSALKSSADAGVTLVEYGIMIGVFGAGMVGAAAFLLTATTTEYEANEEVVAAAPIVCTDDEFFDRDSGLCVPKVECAPGEWANPESNICQAIVECDSGSYADPATNTCLARTTPGAPTNLTGLAASSTSVTLTWQPPDSSGGGVTDYVVEWSLDSGATWPVGNNQTVTTTTATITGLSSTLPQFRVYARNVSGSGPPSAIAVISLNKPSAPTITGVTASLVSTVHSLSVAFTAPTFTGGSAISNYKYSTDGGSSWRALSPVDTTTPITITQTSAGTPVALTGNTEYLIAIRAVNTQGDGTPSSNVQARTVGPAGAPDIVDIISTSQQLSVSFDAPVWGGASPITSYQYSTDNGVTWKTRQTGTTASPLVITTISGGATTLVNGTAYLVRLRAVNSDPTPGLPSVAVTATPGSVPGAPTIGSITKTAANVNPPVLTVPFTAPASNGGSAITIYQYSTDNGVTWKTRTSGTTASPLTISTTSDGLSAMAFNTTYQIKLRAVNAIGNGIASTATAVTTNAGPPNAPTINGVTASTSGTARISITFTAPPSSGTTITNYYYSTDGGSTWRARTSSGTSSPIGSTSSSTDQVYVSSTGAALAFGQTYSIRIRAHGGTSPNWTPAGAQSNAVSVTVGGKSNAPTGLVITPGNQQLSVAFTAPSGVTPAITKYQYSTDDGVTWRDRASGTTASPLVITRTSGTYALLTNGTTYKVRLRAVNAVGPGTESAAVNGTPCGPPGAPKTLAGVVQNAPSAVGISVSWTPNAFTGGCTVSAFRVKYSSDGGNTWSSWITDPNSASPLFIAKSDGLEASTTYVFRAQAFSIGGWSPDSLSSPSVTTPDPPNAPNAPTAAITASPAGIRVTWTPPGGSIVTGYTIQRSVNGGSFGTPLTDTASPLDIAAASLAPSTAYRFRVAATNGWEDTLAYSPASTSLTTPNGPAQPSAPTVTPSATVKEISVTWTALSPVPSGGYLIQRSDDGGATWNTAVADTASPYVDSSGSLQAGTTYRYRVAGVDVWGTGTYSNPGSGTTPNGPNAPSAPTVTPNATLKQINVTWTALSPVPSGGYLIQRSDDGGATWGAAVADAGSPYLDTSGSLQGGTTYQYRVAGVNVWGTGAYSSAGSATTPSGPSTPTLGTLTAGNNSVSIAWTNVSGATSYVLERTNPSAGQTNPGSCPAFPTTPVTATDTNGTPYNWTGLNDKRWYCFRISSVNGWGASPMSATSGLVRTN